MKTPQEAAKLDKLVEKKLISMIKENSPKMLSFFVLQAGRMAIETNSKTMTLSNHATINGQRYKIKNVTTYKKI